MHLKDTLRSWTVSFIGQLPISILLSVKQGLLVRPMDYPRHKILMHADSYDEISRANSCKKEPGTVAWIEEFFKEGDVLYDVGANVGPYSLIAAAFLQGAGRVYAFEPHPSSYAKLCKNIVLNRMGESIIPVAAALSDATGLQVFNYQYLQEGSSGHALGEAVGSRGEAFEPIGAHQILAYRLDDFIRAFGAPVPTHLKVDVDGIESKVLAGAADTLLNPRLRTIIIELEKNEADTQRTVAALAAKGFRLHSVREGRNHLFVR